MDSGPKSPNNKFVESGRINQSESRIKIVVYSVKMKKLHTHTCKKYHRTCPSTMTKSAKFFLFTVVFLQPFALSLSLSFLFLIFFLVCPFLLTLFHIIYYGFYTSSSIYVWVRRWESFFSVLSCLSLNLPLLVVKLLVHCSGITFHINAARELVRQHLIRR